MFTAEAVADPGNLPAALMWFGKFFLTVQCRGIENHMVMDMGFVCMCCDNKLVLSFCKLYGKVVTDSVRIIRGDFAWLEGLAYHVGEDIFFRCLFFSCAGLVDVLAYSKFIDGGFREAFIRADQPAAFRLFRVLRIIDPVTECLGDGLTFVAM